MKRTIYLLATSILLLVGLMSCTKEEVATSTPEYGSMTDIQGNTYKTVKIGNQWWMAENLKVTVFTDNTPIAHLSDKDPDSLWANTTKPAYCIYDTTLGALYNWKVINWKVIDDIKIIAPKGWHIPSDEEWKTLEKTLGMESAESEKTAWRGKEEADKLLTKYKAPTESELDAFGTNESGFSGLFAGCRLFSGAINQEKNTAFWWTSSPSSGNEAWYRYIDAKQKKIFRQHTYTNYGFSIRCIKD
jgi:uncharacterized protein (TIGR02145 family)